MFRRLQIKLVSAFLAVISVFILFTIYTGTNLNQSTSDYQTITTSTLDISKIPSITNQLIELYYHRIGEIKNNDLATQYDQVDEKLNDLFQKLDKTIIYEDSTIAYNGIKHTVMSIQKDCTTGIYAAQENNINASFSSYDLAVKKYFYVEQDTANLVLKETEHTEQIQKDIEMRRTRFFLMGGGALTIVVVLCIIFSLAISHNIISPINQLAKISKQIAEGSTSVQVIPQLLSKRDETGVLSNAFNYMINRLRENVKSLEQSNISLKHSHLEIQVKNEELQRFNKLIIGRELINVKLKQRIRELEEKIAQGK
jgi:nitrogen fixation/metabolism regulation signal transduction histidine kinase